MYEGKFQVRMYDSEESAEVMWDENYDNLVDAMMAMTNIMLEWIENNEVEEGMNVWVVVVEDYRNEDPSTYLAGYKFTNMAWQPYTKDQVYDVNH